LDNGFGCTSGHDRRHECRLSFKLGSMPGVGLAAAHANIKEIALEQNGDYVIYMKLGFLSSQLPGGKQWIKLDSRSSASRPARLGQLMSSSQLQPTDLLGMLKAEGAKVQKRGAATIDGVATTHTASRSTWPRRCRRAG